MVFFGQRDGEEDKGESDKLRLTPLEIDIQFQAAELVFRSLLEGKRPGICHPKDVDEWYAEVLGAEWVEENKTQRVEVARQMKEDGEGTPMWVEAAGHMADIGWEILEVREAGRERVRKFTTVDRTEILEQLHELHPKVQDSEFARCGAGDGLFGLRSCVAILRLFDRDPVLLDITARCLTFIVTGNDYNRDGLVELHLPMPPAVRRDADKNIGWSFLRAALSALMVQAGGEPFAVTSPEVPEEAELDDEDPEVMKIDNVDHEPRREVAVRIAECIVATKDSPAMIAQLRLLREATPEGAPAERHELKQMIEVVQAKTESLMQEEPNQALQDLLDMLRIATS